MRPIPNHNTSLPERSLNVQCALLCQLCWRYIEYNFAPSFLHHDASLPYDRSDRSHKAKKKPRFRGAMYLIILDILGQFEADGLADILKRGTCLLSCFCQLFQLGQQCVLVRFAFAFAFAIGIAI